jgi:hypothetical protein
MKEDEWLKKFPHHRILKYKRDKEKYILEIINKRGYFIKVETYIGWKDRDPRIITSNMDASAIVLGRHFTALNKHIAELYNYTMDIFYACGASAEQIGIWLTRMVDRSRTGAMVYGDDMVLVISGCVIEGDLWRMDTTVRAEILAVLSDKQLSDPFAHKVANLMIDKVGRSTCGIKLKYHGKRGSGDHDTTVGNSDININMVKSFFYGFDSDPNPYDPKERPIRDVLVQQSSETSEQWLERILSMLEKHFAKAGLVLEAKICDIDTVTFCNSRFWPVKPQYTSYGLVTRVLGPKIGRFMSKIGHDAYGHESYDTRKYLVSIAKGWRDSLNHVPVLGHLIETLRNWDGPDFEPYKKVMRKLQYKPKTGYKFEASEATYRMYEKVYKVGRETIQEIENLIKLPFPRMVSHPALPRIVNEDN